MICIIGMVLIIKVISSLKLSSDLLNQKYKSQSIMSANLKNAINRH
jgi:hypothetical protein